MAASLVASLLVCGVAAVAAFGGPPLSYEERRMEDQQAPLRNPLPGRGAQHVPRATLSAGSWRLLERYGTDRGPAVVTYDDLERLSSQQQPPFEYSLPMDFRSDLAAQLQDAMAAAAAQGEAMGAGTGATSAATGPQKGLAAWLPQRVQNWLPSLPTLPSLSSFVPHLPSYLPGIEFEAEVHRKPTRLPHIPTPSEILKDVNSVLDRALQRLHLKQEQILEVIKCTCPRPARCESLFQEFVGSTPTTTPAPGSDSASASGGEPSLSLFTGLTKPDGAGPGFGFFVDQSGAHLGHHVHGAASSSASSSSASSSPASSSSSSASSAGQAAATGSGPASAASATASATASASATNAPDSH